MGSILKYPQIFVNSGLFSTSLIKYDDGNNRTTDIDFVSHNFGFLIFGEVKTFRGGKLHISLQQYTTHSSLHDCYPRSQVYIVGTEDYTDVYDHSIIRYTNFNLIRNGKTPFQHAPDACFNKFDMYPITRLGFSKMLSKKLDFYANPFENPKLDTDFVRSEVGNNAM